LTEEAGSVVAGYLETMSTVWLAEDVTLVDARASRSYTGRAGALEWLRRARLAEAQPSDIHLVVSGEQVAAEWLLRPQGGGAVLMAAFAVVEAGEISALRMYRGGRGGRRVERDPRPARPAVEGGGAT